MLQRLSKTADISVFTLSFYEKIIKYEIIIFACMRRMSDTTCPGAAFFRFTFLSEFVIINSYI